MTPTEYQNIYQQVMDDVMKNVIQKFLIIVEMIWFIMH